MHVTILSRLYGRPERVAAIVRVVNGEVQIEHLDTPPLKIEAQVQGIRAMYPNEEAFLKALAFDLKGSYVIGSFHRE